MMEQQLILMLGTALLDAACQIQDQDARVGIVHLPTEAGREISVVLAFDEDAQVLIDLVALHFAPMMGET